jgi:hypothetical protein
VLERLPRLTADAAIQACLDDLGAFQNGGSREDDLTVMAIRRAE